MLSNLSWGIVIALVLASALLIPYLIKEIRDGKAEFGPYGPRAQHNAPSIQS
jgi:hypothetical protein